MKIKAKMLRGKLKNSFIKMRAQAVICLVLLILFTQANGQHHQTEYAPAFNVARLPPLTFIKSIARVFASAGEKTKAARSYRRFSNVWENAGKELPQIAEAEKWLK